jgi:predicted metal-binding transcription factor (methanogenesis marker protein 9)
VRDTLRKLPQKKAPLGATEFMTLKEQLKEILQAACDSFEREAKYYHSKFPKGHPARSMAVRMAGHAKQEAKIVHKAIKSANEAKMRKAFDNLIGSKRIARIKKMPPADIRA